MRMREREREVEREREREKASRKSIINVRYRCDANDL